MNSKKNTSAMIFAALGIAINIVLGSVANFLSIPLVFLDTIGTIFTAAIFGPWWGALTGGLTNVVQGVISDPRNIPFALVNIAVGIIVGFIARKYKFNLKTAVITGMILAVVAPLIGTPIATYVYGGITGDFNDVIFTWLVQSGQKIFTAAFIPRITSNIVDKILSSVLVALLIKKLPSNLLNGVK